MSVPRSHNPLEKAFSGSDPTPSSWLSFGLFCKSKRFRVGLFLIFERANRIGKQRKELSREAAAE